jgi:hypothetical protein
VLGRHRLERVGDLGVRDPLGARVGAGIDREPVPPAGVLVEDPVSRVVDEEVVPLGELRPQPIQATTIFSRVAFVRSVTV